MKNLKSEDQFYKTEAKVLISENGNDVNGLVSWLLEESGKKREKLSNVRSEIDMIINDPDIEICDQARERLRELSGKMYGILWRGG